MKVLNKLIILFTFVMLFSNTIFASDWVKEGSYYKYKDEDGTFVTSSWRMITGHEGAKYKYYFDENGHMATGIKKIGDEYYFFSWTGELGANANITIDEVKRTTDKDGKFGGMPFGLESQTDFTGEWVHEDDDWRYKQNGEFVKNKFMLIQNGTSTFSVYYFDNFGNMARGLQFINRRYHFFNQDGTAKSYSSVTIGDSKTNPTQGLGRLKDDVMMSDQEIREYNLELRQAELNRLARIEASKTTANINETKAFVPPTVDLTTYSIASKNLNSLVFKNDEGGKLTLTFYVPVIQGPNAELVNTAIASNYSRLVKQHFEDFLDDETTKKKTMKLNELSLYHDQNENSIRITLYGDSSFTIYINANTGEIYPAY